MSEQPVQLTKADLKEILSSNSEMLLDVIRELKKPSEMEQRKLDQEANELLAKNAERQTNAASVIEEMRNKRFAQQMCTHAHRNGNSHCVYIMENGGPGYILCQKRQCKIRPGTPAKGYNGDDIYNTALFNQLFQGLQTSGADIID